MEGRGRDWVDRILEDSIRIKNDLSQLRRQPKANRIDFSKGKRNAVQLQRKDKSNFAHKRGGRQLLCKFLVKRSRHWQQARFCFQHSQCYYSEI